jgi:hypothetical protein
VFELIWRCDLIRRAGLGAINIEKRSIREALPSLGDFIFAMNERPALRPSVAVGVALRGAACDILAEARAAIENPVNSDAEAAHDFRRAMKRWRALLRLIEPFLGTEARHMREEARDRSRRQSEPMLFEVGKRVQRRLSVARASQRAGKTAARPPRPASGPAHAGKLMASRQPLARWRLRLAPSIDERRAAHVAAAARIVARIFVDKPKALRRRFAAMWAVGQ